MANMTMGVWLRVPVFILMWLAFLAVKIPTVVLGFIAVPLMWRYRAVLYDLLPDWTRPWANPEDWFGGPVTHAGSLPKWWVEKHGLGFWSFCWYHAWRNPANGLRSFEFLDLDIEPDRVRYVTNELLALYEPGRMRAAAPALNTSWYWCWQGWRAGFKLVHLWKDLQPHWWTDWKWWIFSGPKSGPRHWVIKLGWRVQPQDAHKDTALDLHREDAGFATKFLPYRKG